MSDVKFENYSVEVKTALNDAVVAWLYEIAGEIQSKAQRNSRVDTGQLQSSWNYKVDESEQKAVIGSPLENAIWEEFGTGIYSVKGNGRKTPWVYEDSKGKRHKTSCKKPNRTLEQAINSVKGKAQKVLEDKLKGAMHN